jgi:hypothetical protein
LMGHFVDSRLSERPEVKDPTGDAAAHSVTRRDQPKIHSLNRIRAVACIAVVASRGRFPRDGGGWLGIDVFFALSEVISARNVLVLEVGQGECGLSDVAHLVGGRW